MGTATAVAPTGTATTIATTVDIAPPPALPGLTEDQMAPALSKIAAAIKVCGPHTGADKKASISTSITFTISPNGSVTAMSFFPELDTGHVIAFATSSCRVSNSPKRREARPLRAASFSAASSPPSKAVSASSLPHPRRSHAAPPATSASRLPLELADALAEVIEPRIHVIEPILDALEAMVDTIESLVDLRKPHVDLGEPRVLPG